MYKCYFQYVCSDRFQLDSQIIKVFKSRYPMDYEPVLEEIVHGEVAFYAHTFIRAGLNFNAWYKVGQSSSVVSQDFVKVIWGTASRFKMTFNEIDCTILNPMENWILWYANDRRIQVGGILPDCYRNVVELGSVMPFIEIVNRIRLGYYTYQNAAYDIVKRIPHPDVHSYTRRESERMVVYSNFLGESVMQEIVVIENGEVQLSEGNPLERPLFWETNWRHKELITKKEFEEAWAKYGGQVSALGQSSGH